MVCFYGKDHTEIPWRYHVGLSLIMCVSVSVLTWAVKTDCGPYRPSYLWFSCTTLEAALLNQSQCSVSMDVRGTAQLPIRMQHLPSSRLCQAIVSGSSALTWWNSIKLIQNKWTGVSSQRKITHSVHLWQPWPATSVVLFFFILLSFFSKSLSQLLIVSPWPSLLLLYFSLTHMLAFFITEAFAQSDKQTHTHTLKCIIHSQPLITAK